MEMDDDEAPIKLFAGFMAIGTGLGRVVDGN